MTGPSQQAFGQSGVKGMHWGVRKGSSGSMQKKPLISKKTRGHIVTATTVAATIVAALAFNATVNGISGSVKAKRGHDFIKSNPAMMKAQKHNGVYTVTTL